MMLHLHLAPAGCNSPLGEVLLLGWQHSIPPFYTDVITVLIFVF